MQQLKLPKKYSLSFGIDKNTNEFLTCHSLVLVILAILVPQDWEQISLQMSRMCYEICNMQQLELPKKYSLSFGIDKNTYEFLTCHSLVLVILVILVPQDWEQIFGECNCVCAFVGYIFVHFMKIKVIYWYCFFLVACRLIGQAYCYMALCLCHLWDVELL